MQIVFLKTYPIDNHMRHFCNPPILSGSLQYQPFIKLWHSVSITIIPLHTLANATRLYLRSLD